MKHIGKARVDDSTLHDVKNKYPGGWFVMMKKFCIVLLISLVLVSGVLAAGNGNHDPDAGNADDELAGGGLAKGLQKQNQTQKQTENQDTEGTGQPPAVEQKKLDKEQTKSLLRIQIEEKKKELDQEIGELEPGKQKVYKNQNGMKIAVHTFLAARDEGLLGATVTGEDPASIGQQVSEFARHFNNSIDASIYAEEQIQSRGAILKFLIGGDEEAARALQQLVIENREQIGNMNRLIQNCACDDDTETLLEEQLQNMEQEQARLQELSGRELDNKGVLGWLWK